MGHRLSEGKTKSLVVWRDSSHFTVHTLNVINKQNAVEERDVINPISPRNGERNRGMDRGRKRVKEGDIEGWREGELEGWIEE